MTELDFGYKVAHRLDAGKSHLSEATRERLFAARQEALKHHHAASSLLSLPGLGHLATDVLFPKARMTAAMLALMVGVACSYTWNSVQKASELEDVDSALLSDELPINAYLDSGFDTWLKDSSQR